MHTSNTRARKFSSKVGKVVMALVFASMIGSIFAAPAFGDDYYHKRGGYYRHNRYEHRRYYSGRVYAPPPVAYDPYPYQSPGITLVFPIRIR